MRSCSCRTGIATARAVASRETRNTQMLSERNARQKESGFLVVYSLDSPFDAGNDRLVAATKATRWGDGSGMHFSMLFSRLSGSVETILF